MLQNIEKLLSPDCRYLTGKYLFYSVVEEWMEIASQEKAEILTKKAFVEIKNENLKRYYQTLFHLLTCPFCMEKKPLLQEKSHPELWRLAFADQITDEVKKIALQNNIHNDQIYYFKLLYQELFGQQKKEKSKNRKYFMVLKFGAVAATVLIILNIFFGGKMESYKPLSTSKHLKKAVKNNDHHRQEYQKLLKEMEKVKIEEQIKHCERFLKRYPNSPYQKLVRKKLKDLYSLFIQPASNNK